MSLPVGVMTPKTPASTVREKLVLLVQQLLVQQVGKRNTRSHLERCTEHEHPAAADAVGIRRERQRDAQVARQDQSEAQADRSVAEAHLREEEQENDRDCAKRKHADDAGGKQEPAIWRQGDADLPKAAGHPSARLHELAGTNFTVFLFYFPVLLKMAEAVRGLKGAQQPAAGSWGGERVRRAARARLAQLCAVPEASSECERSCAMRAGLLRALGCRRCLCSIQK